ncbi:MAG: hypothetical protein AAB968_04035 [Patescibacteria group bacterium]
MYFFLNSLRGYIASIRTANRVYPQFFRSFFFFSASGIMLSGLWVIQWFFSPTVFSTPNPFVHTDAYVTSVYLPLAFGLATVLYGFVLQSFSRVAWRFFLIVGLLFSGFMFFMAIATHPLHSEDAYWNLFYGKAFAIYHINPYITPPASILPADPWISSFSAWKEVLMVYGPLWTIIISSIVLMGKTLAGSLLVLKALEVFLFACAGYILWRVMEMHEFSLEKKSKLMIFLAWNPFVLHAAVVDGHNDILILMAMLASYYFFLKKDYHYSIISLVFGGFVKYVSLLAIPIPLFFLAISHIPVREKFFKFGSVAVVSLLLLFSLYAPFGGLQQENFYGASFMVTTPGSLWGSHQIVLGAIVSATLRQFVSFGVFEIRIVGLIIGVVVIVYLIWKKNIIGGYVYPYVFIFLFATPWFWPWYALWIFPLLAVMVPLSTIIFTSAFLMIALGVFSTVHLSSIFLLGVFFYAIIRPNRALIKR